MRLSDSAVVGLETKAQEWRVARPRTPRRSGGGSFFHDREKGCMGLRGVGVGCTRLQTRGAKSGRCAMVGSFCTAALVAAHSGTFGHIRAHPGTFGRASALSSRYGGERECDVRPHRAPPPPGAEVAPFISPAAL